MSDVKAEIESLKAKLRAANERAAEQEILLIQSKRWLDRLSVYVAGRTGMRAKMHSALTGLLLSIDSQTGVRP